jgi:GT2 family glycosyltransferase
MNIAVVVAAYNQPAWTRRLVESAAGSRHDVEIHLFLHSRDASTVAACEELAERPDVRYHPFGTNRGLSRTWNDGILAAYGDGADVVLVANDDIALAPGDVARLAAKAAAHRDRYIVTCAGYHHRLARALPSHGYACFAINPVAIEVIGCFDENFFPAYCEDQDYSRRARLAGLHEENCADTRVEHGGSSVIHSSPDLAAANGVTHGRNIAYYRRKWGGDGDHERFEQPFANPEFGLHIAPECRAHPYGPGFDRRDLSV